MAYKRKPAKNFDDLFRWLDEAGPVTYKQLAAKVGLASQYAEQIMQSMEYAGYLLSEDERGLVYAYNRIYRT